jgi:hypothetical protein
LLVLALAAVASAGIGVTIDGEVMEGKFRVDGAKVFVLEPRHKDEEEHARDEFYLIEREDGSFVWAPDFEGRLRGYEILVRSRRRERLVDLAGDAVRAYDAKLARRVFELAESDGYTGKSADRLKKKIEKLEGKNPRIREERAAAVEKELVDVQAMHPRLLLDRTKKALAADRESGLRLLRALLLLAPKDKGALELVEAQKPKDFPLGDARFWLDFHLDLEAKGATLAPDELRDLKMVRATWRKDLYGVMAGPMRVFTPVKDTRTVGRCLAYGQLTCRVLDGMFQPEKEWKRAADGAMVLLYASKKEYMTVRGTGGMIRDPKELEWTTGYYSPTDRLSRVYWHKDRDAERRIARTFVHELTHHWLQELNPCYADAHLRRSPMKPGYWIVEGFATFIEEGRFDIDTMTFEPFDRRARTLDVVHALASKRALIPWSVLFKLNQLQFKSIDRKTKVEFYRKWAMGKQIRTPPRLFYDQAAAACHFLYHGEDGKFRRKLMDYVIAYYTGQKEKLDPQAAFGLPADELGRRIEKFADDVANGWTPEGE